MNRSGRTGNILWLLFWLLVSFSAAALGSYWNQPSVVTWYPELQRPSWTPPSWVFAPVWTTLYFLMGVSAWLVWKQRERRAVTLPIAVFLIQLALNAVWSGLFFALRRPDLAFFEIILLWLSILWMIRLFKGYSSTAAFLQIPYLVWVSFAAALNLGIWQMN